MSLVKIIALLLEMFAGQCLDNDKIPAGELRVWGVTVVQFTVHHDELCVHSYILQRH